MESNLRDLAGLIFDVKEGPKNIGSIMLQLDFSDERLVYEVLFETVKHGIEILYGEKDILKLSESQVMKLDRYLWAINFRLKVTANEIERTPWEILKSGEVLETLEIKFQKIK